MNKEISIKKENNKFWLGHRSEESTKYTTVKKVVNIFFYEIQ